MKETWVDYIVGFYDFIWREATQSCAHKVNAELIEDFQSGGTKYEEMKALIAKKYPTIEDARKAYEASLV